MKAQAVNSMLVKLIHYF